MDIETNYPIGTKVKITQKDETGIGTGVYKVSTNFGVVSGYSEHKRSIRVELTSGMLVDNPNYNHKHVVHPVDHHQCTTEIIK